MVIFNFRILILVNLDIEGNLFLVIIKNDFVFLNFRKKFL